MLGHTKRHHISQTNRKYLRSSIFLSEKGQIYEFPKSIIIKLSSYIMTDATLAKKAKIKFEKILSISPEEVFADINKKFTKPGAMLKGVRLREGLSQEDFAKKIHIRQGDLSKMESGKRPIGKMIAHRIAHKFKVNYKFFL
jgi:DNA-binding XRE family transcriptional regulator